MSDKEYGAFEMLLILLLILAAIWFYAHFLPQQYPWLIP